MRFLRSWGSIIFAALLFGALFLYTDRAEAQSITLSNGVLVNQELMDLMLEDNIITHQVVNLSLAALQCIETSLTDPTADYLWEDCRAIYQRLSQPLFLRHSAVEEAIKEARERVAS